MATMRAWEERKHCPPCWDYCLVLHWLPTPFRRLIIVLLPLFQLLAHRWASTGRRLSFSPLTMAWRWMDWRALFRRGNTLPPTPSTSTSVISWSVPIIHPLSKPPTMERIIPRNPNHHLHTYSSSNRTSTIMLWYWVSRVSWKWRLWRREWRQRWQGWMILEMLWDWFWMGLIEWSIWWRERRLRVYLLISRKWIASLW